LKTHFVPHIAVEVGEPDRAVAFYRKVLGMEIVAKNDNESQLQCGDLHLYVGGGTPGRTYLAFETDDLDAASAELEATGCVLDTFDGEGRMVHDPFGLKFYLSETREEK
jgi:catechol 2,3-dioxygenase-like lactoylglutathione lyase family enzyme